MAADGYRFYRSDNGVWLTNTFHRLSLRDGLEQETKTEGYAEISFLIASNTPQHPRQRVDVSQRQPLNLAIQRGKRCSMYMRCSVSGSKWRTCVFNPVVEVEEMSTQRLRNRVPLQFAYLRRFGLSSNAAFGRSQAPLEISASTWPSMGTGNALDDHGYPEPADQSDPAVELRQ